MVLESTCAHCGIRIWQYEQGGRWVDRQWVEEGRPDPILGSDELCPKRHGGHQPVAT